MERMSTRIQTFQCHRQVETNYVTGTGDDKAVGWTGDKITYTDPIIYFYRETYGKPEPGAFTASANKDDFLELCKKKRISHCKDGFYWTTRFPTKGERKIVDTEELRKLFDGSNARTITKDRLLTTFGVEPKGDTADVRDIHNMQFFIGRETMQKLGLMENNLLLYRK